MPDKRYKPIVLNMSFKAIFFDLGDTLVVSATRSWIPGAKELLDALHRTRIRLGVISNTGNLRRGQLTNLLPADFSWAPFEDSLIILSAEVNIQKPSPGIFELAVRHANLSPKDCLFITEDALDCLSAQQTGMKTYRLQKPPNSDIGGVLENLRQLDRLR